MPQVGGHDREPPVDGTRSNTAIGCSHSFDRRRPALIEVFIRLGVRQCLELPQKFLGQHEVTISNGDEESVFGSGWIQFREDPNRPRNCSSTTTAGSQSLAGGTANARGFKRLLRPRKRRLAVSLSSAKMAYSTSPCFWSISRRDCSIS